MAIGQKTVVTVAFGETRLVAARFTGIHKWPPRCVAVESVAVEQDGYGEALHTLGATGILRRAELHVVVPRHRVTTRVLDLPSTDPAEIRHMVQLDAGSYVPYPIEDMVISQAILGASSEGFSTVMVVLVQRDEINKILAPLRDARLNPRSAVVSSLALYNACMAVGMGDEDGYVATVHIGTSGLDVVVSHGGELAFTRGVSCGGGWSAEKPLAEPAIDTIVREVRTSIEASEREAMRGAALARIYLAGEVASLDQLRDRLATDLGLEVTVLGPADIGHTLPVAVLAGAALSRRVLPAAVSINVLPDDFIAARARVVHHRYLAVCGVFLTVSVLLAVQISRDRANDKLRFIEYLDARISDVEPTARLVRKKQSRVRAVRAQRERGFTVLNFLATLHQLAPEDLVLRRVEFDREVSARVYGRARSRPIAFDYVERLRGSGEPYFEKVEMGTLTEALERGQTVINFQVIAPFVSEEGESEETGEEYEDYGDDEAI